MHDASNCPKVLTTGCVDHTTSKGRRTSDLFDDVPQDGGSAAQDVETVCPGVLGVSRIPEAGS